MGEGSIQMLGEKRKVKNIDDSAEQERAQKKKTCDTFKVYSRRETKKVENKFMDLLDEVVVPEKNIYKPLQFYSRRKFREVENKSSEKKIGSEKGSKSIVQKSSMVMNEGDVMRRSSRIQTLAAKNKISKTQKKIDSMENHNGYAKVQEAIKAFNKLYLHSVQKEELRSETTKEALKNKTRDAKKPSKRPDLKAMKKMIKNNTTIYREKRPGHLPGIDVGDDFYSHAEMYVLGLHGQTSGGIDYMGAKYEKMEKYKNSNYKFPMAVSIVLSGQYEDDEDNSDVITYTGQGGNNSRGDKLQRDDQKMERGNLALFNNIQSKTPVRVIRGEECTGSLCGRVYTYDGLYRVVQCSKEIGRRGFNVYKYRLERLEGQPALTTKQVRFTKALRAPKSVEDLPGLVCDDISGGKEKIPIPATNSVDNTPFPPTGFTYTTTSRFSANIEIHTNSFGCKCKGKCEDPATCACAQLNGSDFPYTSSGRLTEAKDVVYECGPHCGCGRDCISRTSRRGLKYRLEVFRTPNKGWGVRSWDFIPIGAFVCEYIGVVKRDKELTDKNNFYIMDIDCLQTIKGIKGRQKRQGNPTVNPSALINIEDDDVDDNVDYCIDSESIGNVTRFINHSCAPNLYVQCILSDHQDARLARVVLYASTNIPPYRELCYDYGYDKNSVADENGNIKHMRCCCGARECREFMF